VHTFRQVMCDMLTDYGYMDMSKVFPYPKFKTAWYEFLKLLDIDMSDGFMCSTCSTSPAVIVCDGNFCGIPKENVDVATK
jgi:hypothetical protein